MKSSEVFCRVSVIMRWAGTSSELLERFEFVKKTY
jgi:hypothetical protein